MLATNRLSNDMLLKPREFQPLLNIVRILVSKLQADSTPNVALVR